MIQGEIAHLGTFDTHQFRVMYYKSISNDADQRNHNQVRQSHQEKQQDYVMWFSQETFYFV